jgi:hypothetical protein
VTVHLFFNPDLVGQLAACGITQRRQLSPGTATPGFVLEGRRSPPRGREAVTNVVAVHGPVTITGPRQQPAGRPTTLALPTSMATGPQDALELAEECTRLRRSNQLLTDEVARLRAEVERLTGAGSVASRQREQDLDDSAKRFSLLELDL